MQVRSADVLADAIEWSNKRGIPRFVLGGGSNVLISDDGFDGLVIKMAITGISYKDGDDSVVAVVGAGENWDAFVADTVERELWGVENLSGIPGTVGAAPIQNVGAYGQEVAYVIEWVEVYDAANIKRKRLSPDECSFGYRDSIFKHEEGDDLIVTRVALRLKKGGEPNRSYKDLQHFFHADEEPTLYQMREAVLEIRRGKFPDLDEAGTGGSFFKNPIISRKKYETLQKEYPDMPGYELDGGSIKIPFAWILDNVFDLKGHYERGVGFFEKQPLVVINKGSGMAEDVHFLTQPVIDRTKDEFGIDIEREVTLVGNR